MLAVFLIFATILALATEMIVNCLDEHRCEQSVHSAL